MKKLIYGLLIYLLALNNTINSKKPKLGKTIPVIKIKPGEKKTLLFENNPKNFDIHENNKMRYIRNFKCKENGFCKLQIKRKAQPSEPFAIYNDDFSDVKAYVEIIENKN